MRAVVVRLSVVGSLLAVAIVAVGCWFETAFVAWVTNLGVLVILLLVTVVYDQPGRHLVRSPFAWLYPLGGAVGIASVVRIRDISWPHVSSTAMGGIVVTMVVLAFVVVGLREPGRVEVAAPLVFPLPSGRWTVAAGGVTALNHHLADPSQAAGLDLVAVRRDGARGTGVCPPDLEAYEAYGQEVVSPCGGVVVAAVDGEADQPPYRIGRGLPAGNHVRIDNGSEILLLAHLRPGSLRVSTGDEVTAGQLIGEVGSSGRSTEPHLHVHAERDGQGVRLRFDDRPAGRLWPGAVRAAGHAERDVRRGAGGQL